MARFEVRPVASQTNSNSWSHTLILSDTAHLLDASIQPVWIITLSLSGSHSDERGPELLESISDAYQQIEFKIPEALYQTLQSHLENETQVSVAAICFTPTNTTIIGKGKFHIQVWRESKPATILQGDNLEWSAVEGKWQPTDRWWLMAGDHIPDEHTTLLDESNIETAAETLHSTIITSTSPTANVLITCHSALPIETDVSSSTIYLPDKPHPKIINKRRVMAVGWLVLILLIISVLFGAQARSEKLLSQNFNQLENQVNQSIAAATALQPIDQVQARATLRQLQDQMNQSQPQFADNKKWAAKWIELNTVVSTTYQQLAGVVSPEDLPEWFALSVVKPDFKGDRLILTNDQLFVLDKISNTLVKINTESKQAEVVAGGNALQDSVNIATDGSRAIVITQAGIKEISLSKKTITDLVVNDGTWQSPTALSLFNSNIYLLDSLAGDIWRYSGVTGGVSPKQRWLGSGVTIPSTDLVDMDVDGDLWLLQSTGIINRYRRGATLTFNLTGLDVSLSSATAFSVNPDQDTITILDAVTQRILRFDKQGNYQKQITWAGLSQSQDIAVSSDSNTVYILKNGSIYTTQF